MRFLDDAWGGTPDTDRNLYLDGVSYNGAEVPDSALALYSASDGEIAFTERTAAPTFVESFDDGSARWPTPGVTPRRSTPARRAR